MAGSYGSKLRRRAPLQQQRKQQTNCGWLLNLSVTALAAGTLVVFGHWFNARQGRRLGGNRRRGRLGDEENNDIEDDGRKKAKNWTGPNHTQPMSLAELRLRRLTAAEARLQPTKSEPSAARLTPLGMILELTQKVDKLEDEAKSLLGKASAGAMSLLEEKEQVQLLELLALLQLEVDAVQADESVRPHRRSQTNRIQTLIAELDQLKQTEVSLEMNLG